jgi:uncharacterized protein
MVLSQIAAMVLAVFVGLSLGALGSGGAIITVPLLVYLAHVSPLDAIGMSLAIVGATSLVGVILHFRLGNVALRRCCFLLSPARSVLLSVRRVHTFSRERA